MTVAEAVAAARRQDSLAHACGAVLVDAQQHQAELVAAKAAHQVDGAASPE